MTTATVRAERFVSSRPQAASASLRSATIAFWLVGCTSPGLSRDHAQRVVNLGERRRPTAPAAPPRPHPPRTNRTIVSGRSPMSINEVKTITNSENDHLGIRRRIQAK